MTLTSYLLVGGTFAFIVQTSLAQNSTASNCSDYEPFGPVGTSYNASGSYQVLGFQEPGSNTVPTNWTYNYAVQAQPDGDFSSAIWIDTSDGMPIGSRDRPYIGCVEVLLDLPQNTIRRGQDDSGDCTETFDEDCVSALTSIAISAGESYSGTDQRARGFCGGVFTRAVPSECEPYVEDGRWGGGVSSARGDGSNNDTTYDQAITRVVPVLTTVWLKDDGEGNTNSMPWADARLTCMTGRDIMAGSREPASVPSLGPKIATGGINKAFALIAIMMIGMVLTPGINKQSHTKHNTFFPYLDLTHLAQDLPSTTVSLISSTPSKRPTQMSQYYPQPSQPYNPQQNLNFYQSSYPAPVSGHSTPSQAQYPYSNQNGYGQPPSSSNVYGGSSSFGGFGGGAGGGGGAPGTVSGRMGEHGGLRTGWLAAFGTEGYEGEPPLLEELGVNFGHIKGKTLTVLNPLAPISQHIMDDSDLAGPILFFLLFGTFLLFSGKVHFGYIYGLAL
ncbi:MAG: hypothetical protein Q9216_006621, partial [Gyalolechia sp. 2 TL-2023]